MRIYNNILETVGNTPIVRFNEVCSSYSSSERKKSRIFGKLEFWNPGRSVKDRIALQMINCAEEEQLLHKQSIILESSSGNTGIGLSLVSRVKGYSNIIVVDQNCPSEKLKLLRALGAKVIMLTSGDQRADDLTERRIDLVNALQEIDENIFVPNQYQNHHAPEAHYLYTAEEIISFMEETGLFFQTVVISVGTGGTISGVSKRLKEYDSSIRVVGVEPEGSTLFGGEKGAYLQQGPGNYFVPTNLIYEHIDLGLKVSDQNAFNMCRRLALHEGLLTGGSSGAVVHAAIELPDAVEGNTLCILPDGGEKYLDSIYSDEWLAKHGIVLNQSNYNQLLEVNIDNVQDYRELAERLKNKGVNAN